MATLEEQKSENQEQYKEFVPIDAIANPTDLLKDSTDKLAKYGGFDILELVVDGVQNMNPSSKARRKIFLSEKRNADKRDALKKSLSLWTDALTNGGSVAEMVDACEKKAEIAEKTLKQNLTVAINETKELEQSYRSVAMFFNNAKGGKLKNVSFVNGDLEQLSDLDNPTFFKEIEAEIADNYDRLDLKNSYSLLVLPGYLGSNMVVDKWAQMAHENKVMLVTDFMHLDKPDDVIELFEEAKLTSGDAYKANVMMTCNWLVGRGKYEEFGEEEDFYIPASTAVAGNIYQTLMSQVAAGKKHGTLNEVDGVAFQMRKSEIAQLEKMGLVPMVNEYGKVMAMSAKTLFEGDNLGLQTYSVVRVFDYITKVMMDFLNRRTHENFTTVVQKDIRRQIAKFLDGITGPGKLIEKFSIKRLEQDPKQKDKINLDIHMTPYFPAKSFMIKMDGKKGDDGNEEWGAEYEQQ